MPFPTINHIDDVLPHIPPDAGIFVREREDYRVIDYAYVADDTFSNPVALECRGLKFDGAGHLIGRPFHKFFNLGERERLEDVAWTEVDHVLDKLDGSMVHPALVDGELVLMTRGGISEQARAALAHASEGVVALCRETLARGETAIFEYTGPENRIVLAYDDPRLTLLAVRDMETGTYRTQDDLVALARRHDVPVVAARDPLGETVEAVGAEVQVLRAFEGIEGFVLVFRDGHRLKLKTDAYALRHKALSALANERHVLTWVLEGIVDDIVPLLSDENAALLRDYEGMVHEGIGALAVRMAEFHSRHGDLERKDYAARVIAEMPVTLRPVAFALADGHDPRAAVTKVLDRAKGQAARIDTVRDLFGMEWSPASFVEIE